MSPFGRNSAAPSELTYSLLSGLRIIEISAFIAAPLAGLTLAQLGAEVIRIDPVGGGMDKDRWPIENGRSLYWSGLNRAKKSVCLDLKTPEGQAVLHGLLRTGGSGGGIILTNLTGPDWLEFDRLSEVRPDLIMVDLKGHHDGAPAVDYTVNAAVGVPFATGPEDVDGPVNHMLPAWDAVAGLSLSTAVLAALRARDETGKKQHLSVALSDVAYAFLGNTGLIAETELTGTDRPRIGNHIYGAFGQDLPTRDGRHVMVAAITGGQWRALVKATGMGEELSRLEHQTGLDFSTDAGRYEGRNAIADLMRDWSSKLDFEELVAVLLQDRALAGPYRTFTQMLKEDPRASVQNPMFQMVDHPDVGRYRVPGSAIRVNDTDEGELRAGPKTGQHSRDVIRSAGFSDQDFDELVARNIAGEGT